MKSVIRRASAGGMTALLLASASFSAQGAVTITPISMEKNGVGYIIPTLNPDPSVTQLLIDLNKCINIYNNPHKDSGVVGVGKQSGPGTFHQFPKDPVPEQLPHATSLAKTGNVTGGDKSALVIDLGKDKYDYLIVRWDGKQGSDSIYYIGGINGGKISLFDEPGYINFDKKAHNASSYWLADPTVVPVPEPSTVLAGALLLVPFGLTAIRAVRRKGNR